MNRNQMDFLGQVYKDCKNGVGRPPDFADFIEEVGEIRAKSNDPSIRILADSCDDGLLQEAYERMANVEEAIDTEMNQKVRDARANLENRTYVDGSF